MKNTYIQAPLNNRLSHNRPLTPRRQALAALIAACCQISLVSVADPVAVKQTQTIDRTLVAAIKLDTTGDTDEDGLSDGEESFRYGTFVNRADSDLDGISDFQELFDGLNALNIVPRVSKALQLVAGFTLDTTPDQDGDGLSDGRESESIGTRPLLRDSDFDGVGDFAELLDGRSPLRSPVVIRTLDRTVQSGGFLLDTTGDADQDGLSDGYERNVSMTNVNLFDTDEDGTGDGDEVFAGTNPLDRTVIVVPISLSFGIASVSDTSLTIFFEGTGNPSVRLLGSPDLRRWEEIDILSFGDGESFSTTLEIPMEFDVEFFRVEVLE